MSPSISAFAAATPLASSHLAHPFHLPSLRPISPPHLSTPRRATLPLPLSSPVPTMSAAPLAVMVNGVPGRMAAATAAEVVSRGLTLAKEALTGDGMSPSIDISGVTVSLSPPDDHAACLARVLARHPRLVVVDYTHPSACNANAALYAAAGVSFVVGTTGGDSAAMREAAEGADGVYAVVAPNMGKQIVAFQAMMASMAADFPGVFNGYAMTVTESHQAGKADTSGTAKAVVQSFNDMGVEFDVGDIEMVRRAPESMDRMGVPGKYVTTGHAYHTYALTSADGTVNFEFRHNVCGRAVYAAGTVDAVEFLEAQRAEAGSKRVFNMIDILRAGKMKD